MRSFQRSSVLPLVIVASLSAIAVVACGGAHNLGCFNDTKPCESADAAPPPPVDAGLPDSVPIFSDAAIPDAAAVIPPFFLLTTETPNSPANDGSNWGSVLRFEVSGDYQQANPVPGIAKGATIVDPLGLAFRWTSASLFVANRGGINHGQASIASFPYNASTHTFGAGTTLVSGYTSFMQLTFNHLEDEIFVGTNNEGMRRFKLQGSQWVEVLPQLVTANDWIRGVAVSPDGKRLYASTAGSDIRQWDLTTNQELASYTVKDPGAWLHFMSLCGPEISDGTTVYSVGCSPTQLYVGDARDTGGAIYRFDIDANDNLTNETRIKAAPTFSSALSPDGLELFGGESVANDIQRFQPPPWTLESALIHTKNNIGTILVFPSNAVPIPIH